MSKRLQVVSAVKAMIQAALPLADVVGLDPDEAKPDALPPGGLVIVRAGDPGEPDVDLSPLAYNYSHAIPLEVAAATEDLLDAMLGAIGAGVAADRTLGGLCDFLQAGAPSTDDFDATGAAAGRWADLQIDAEYSTPDPLN